MKPIKPEDFVNDQSQAGPQGAGCGSGQDCALPCTLGAGQGSLQEQPCTPGPVTSFACVSCLAACHDVHVSYNQAFCLHLFCSWATCSSIVYPAGMACRALANAKHAVLLTASVTETCTCCVASASRTTSCICLCKRVASCKQKASRCDRALYR